MRNFFAYSSDMERQKILALPLAFPNAYELIPCCTRIGAWTDVEFFFAKNPGRSCVLSGEHQQHWHIDAQNLTKKMWS